MHYVYVAGLIYMYIWVSMTKCKKKKLPDKKKKNTERQHEEAKAGG